MSGRSRSATYRGAPPRRTGRGIEPKLPPALDRRFEALVFDWDGTAVPDRGADAGRVRALVERLCTAGMELAVVSGTHVGNIDGQLRARPSGPGRLHLLLNRGSEVFQVQADGPELVWRREASAEEEAALTAAAERTVARLREHGLAAEIVSQRLNRRKIDLIPDPAWADPPKARIADLLAAIEERLRSHGIGSLAAVADLASQAAAEAGLPEPRITSDAKHVEIGLTDKADSSRWILRELWQRGIGPGLVLFGGDEFGSLGGFPGSDSLMLVPEAGRAVAVSIGAEPTGVPPGVVALGGGPEAFLELLEDQLARRRSGAVPELDADPAWTVLVDGLDLKRERAHETILTLADGAIGTRGVPPGQHPAASPGVFASGVYVGDGPETALAQVPAWNLLPFELDSGRPLRRALDLHTGALRQELETASGPICALAFSSLARPGIAVLRLESPRRHLEGSSPLQLPAADAGPGEIRRRRAVVEGKPGGVAVDAADETHGEGRMARLDRLAAYVTDVSAPPSTELAATRLEEARRAGFDELLAEHRLAWARRWEDADVRIEGDENLQRAVRFALFHLMASVADTGEAAVGARGLSGRGYRGHVFWDSDVFVLPFLAATHPRAARAMLEYRLHRLHAAVEAARRLGRVGARFPWESAASGYDVTPSSARDRAGGVVPIRTGLLEEHIVADVAWAGSCYLDWTGDLDFATGPGLALFVETARYWASRIRLGDDGRAHIYGVVGPDEYHEPVDDNAFTNVMARWNLRRALRAVEGSDAVGSEERERWHELADLLADGYDPATGLYEEFAGFFELEPLLIAEFAPRRPIVAEALLGRERTRASQVVKQADVLMLHHLVPEEIAPGSLEPNLSFYEPRTAHGSSLSPAVHAALFARAGRLQEAVELLGLAARLDLDDLTETTASGLHLATMGGVWQALARGFAGLRPAEATLALDPRLPEAWRALELTARFQGSRVRIRIEDDALAISADPTTAVSLAGEPKPLAVGPSGLRLQRDGERWKRVRP